MRREHCNGAAQLCYSRGQQIVANFVGSFSCFFFFFFEMSKLMQSGVKKSDVLWWVRFALICVKIFSKLHLFPHCGNSHFMLLTHKHIHIHTFDSFNIVIFVVVPCWVPWGSLWFSSVFLGRYEEYLLKIQHAVAFKFSACARGSSNYLYLCTSTENREQRSQVTKRRYDKLPYIVYSQCDNKKRCKGAKK